MWRAQSDSRLFAATILGLVLASWAALAVWGTTPQGALLDHSQVHDASVLSWRSAGTTTLFVTGWLLMTVAMMLPTSLPLILLFHRITNSRPNREFLIGLLLLGYLAVWSAFGVAAHVMDFGIHRLVESHAWLHANSWTVAALPLLTAGIYQFTPLKYVCLDKCRSPYSFVVEHWRGRNAMGESLKLGLHHGLFCVGCCWSLMLLMFAVSVGNLVWMLVLGILMGAEKNLPWGRRLSTPIGVVLLTAGVTVVAMNLGVML